MKVKKHSLKLLLAPIKAIRKNIVTTIITRKILINSIIKRRTNSKKRSLGAKEPSKEKGRLNTFSKVNSMKDSTQRPNKKKVTAIVPGESLSTRQSSSGQSSMDNDVKL